MINLDHISFMGAEPQVRTRAFHALPACPPASCRTPSPREMEVPLDPLMGWMLGRAGLPADAYRPAAMQRRVAACLRKLHVTDAGHAMALVERRPETLALALSTILIGVSEFFRDRPVFEHLEKVLLPEMLATRSGLRVCSAGSSDGHELYSMAMLLADAGALDESVLIGVDCRTDAIRRAQAGLFTEEDIASVEGERRSRYFTAAGDLWAAADALKRRIRWRSEDLFTFEAGEPCDFILFRNVAIYLNERHSALLWTRLCSQLSPGGYVITGKAEKPPGTLPLVRVAPCIYQRNEA